MADTKVYALDEGKNAYETMTKEQIVAAITQAVNEGTISDIDAGFITKIQEMNKKGELQFWAGTMAEFNALETKDPDTLYLFTDDPTVEDLGSAIDVVSSDLASYKAGNDAEIAQIKGRLDALGFKEGVAGADDFSSVTANSLKKQGKYVIFSLAGTADKASPTVQVPAGFRPKAGSMPSIMVGITMGWDLVLNWATDGSSFIIPAQKGAAVNIVNAGWETD